MQRRVTIALGSALLGIAAVLLGLASLIALLPVVEDRPPARGTPLVVTMAAMACVPSAFGLSYLLAASQPGRRALAWAYSLLPWLLFALSASAVLARGFSRNGGRSG